MVDTHFATQATNCPYHQGGDERKSAPAPATTPGAIVVEKLGLARQILRSDRVRQAGFRAELLERFGRREHAPVLYQGGEAHQKQRSAIARFFAPKIVSGRYRELMERLSDRLIERLQTTRRAQLDLMSLDIAVAVAAEIVGLTEGSLPSMASRLNRFFTAGAQVQTPHRAFVSFILVQHRVLQFYLWDVRPAIRARKRIPREDVISHLIARGRSHREILTECLMYGAAGMATTREFIVMAAWHLFERDGLKARFLVGDEATRIAILEEILRLEPVVGALYRRADHDLALEDAGETFHIPAGSLLALDVRGANADSAAGKCPHELDPDRAGAGVPGSLISFGDGPHRCPGAAVALQEAAIFLDRLFRVPGIRLENAPVLAWNPTIAGYELRGAVVTVD
jgi:cytochrome P450